MVTQQEIDNIVRCPKGGLHEIAYDDFSDSEGGQVNCFCEKCGRRLTNYDAHLVEDEIKSKRYEKEII